MPADGGTYTLLIEIPNATTIEVGALGEIAFEAGWYAYTGSAFGPGGFARVERHREIASGERGARHWHVDYLLGETGTMIDGLWASPGADRECEIAGDLPGHRIRGFGASDCECPAHLVGAPSRSTEVAALDDCHDRRGIPRD